MQLKIRNKKLLAITLTSITTLLVLKPNIALSLQNQNMSPVVQKTIKEICRKPRPHWVGDGFHVYPVFANKAFTSELSPFLMFDYAAPKEFSPNNQKRGVGMHPHRGFETVTIAFQGEVEHGDSKGNSGVIGPGDVQWMTAAKGIVHEEFHSQEFAKKGGIFEMCQLWVNLPKKYKMIEPRYQAILNNDIPKVQLQQITNKETGECSIAPLDNGYVRIISGEFHNTKGPAKTYSPVNLWDVVLSKKDIDFEFVIEAGHTLLVFVRRGGVKVQGEELKLADVAIMNQEGTVLTIRGTDDDSSVLILSGEPIHEPIAARGPFVMNTNEELNQAMMDYRFGQNGF